MEGGERMHVALRSARDLHEYLEHLTERELLEALDFETATRRRPVIIERLIQRLVRVKELALKAKLVKEYAPWLESSR